MTPYEHAMVGITGVLATGLNRRYGWPIAGLAAVAAVSPDWDGLALVAGSAAFAARHRVWGHNVLVCVLSGLLLGVVDYRFDMVGCCGRYLTRKLRLSRSGGEPRLREARSLGGWVAWISVAILAALSHLLADLLFSGSATLPAWELQPWWPLSRAGYAFPWVPWGDPGVSIVFVAGMFAMWKWSRRLQPISLVTLAAVVLYVVVRGARGFP